MLVSLLLFQCDDSVKLCWCNVILSVSCYVGVMSLYHCIAISVRHHCDNVMLLSLCQYAVTVSCRLSRV